MIRKLDSKLIVATRLPVDSRRAFTIIELMIAFVILAILSMTAFNGLKMYRLRSLASESSVGLSKMISGELEYVQKKDTYIAAGPTNMPPTSTKVAVDFTADPSWKEINFSFSDPILFGYQADLISPAEVNCLAIGDLNGDGVTSLYRRTASRDAEGKPVAGDIYYFDELE